ncbi:hypothetical protein PAT3040_01922 [Paenibacillus agaridevorans]|uniref:Lipoprotein n=1 Tax=Paenibacillus agaridevorans TaxID=171404 RepID=A0A2R5EVG5_9BACL|nr:hypothetical protein [Paenibacillus agaridevorans]GBG07374.1 hypothetical protein PAT3040_01922 [Paenibacillus agaridevorans]
MRVKVLSLILIFMVLIGCNGPESTTGYIQVKDKSYDNGKYYLTVVNPYENRPEILNLKTEKNVWNLAIIGEIYFATYENKSTLSEIEYPDKTSEEEK